MAQRSGVRSTVLVVTWRGQAHLAGCLAALAAQDRPHRTIVVDNASDDGTADVLAAHADQVEVLRLPANRGYAGGLAAALPIVDTEYVAWLNDDAMPEPGWLGALESALDADPATAAAASRLVRPDGTVQSVGVRITADGHGADLVPPNTAPIAAPITVPAAAAGAADPAPGTASTTGPTTGASTAPSSGRDLATDPTDAIDAIDATDATGPADGKPVAAEVASPSTASTAVAAPPAPALFGFCGGAVLLRTTALRAAGGVPAAFFCYYEDTDTSWRLRLQGWAIRFVPTATVRHLHGASTRPGSADFHRWNERNRLLMLLRCAPTAIAVRESARFVALTAVLAARTVLRRDIGVPDTANFQPRLRLRVLADIARRLPETLAERRVIGHTARVRRITVWRRWAGR